MYCVTGIFMRIGICNYEVHVSEQFIYFTVHE